MGRLVASEEFPAIIRSFHRRAVRVSSQEGGWIRMKKAKTRRVKPAESIVQSALQWTIGWGVAGIVLGIPLMLLKAIPMGRGPSADDPSFYAFWVPALALGAAAAGLGIGFLYAGLMTITEEWRLQYEQDTPGLKGQLLPPVICGAAAGLVPGLLVGGFGGAAFFAMLGAASAAAHQRYLQRA